MTADSDYFAKLPAELQRQIFSLLDKEELVHCLTICKSWCNIIQQQSSLYQSVHIGSKAVLKGMYSFFRSHPEFQRLVKRICINEIGLEEEILPLLPSVLPDIEEFQYFEENKPQQFWWNGKEREINWKESEARRAFSIWADSIRSVYDLGTPLAAFAILANRKLDNLVHLNMSFIGMPDEQLKKNFIQSLAHAPNLSILRTQWVTYSMKDVDNIHKYARNLRVLSFYQVGFYGGRGKKRVVDVSETADKIETLTADYATFFEPEGPWMRYFAQKYPNLRNLVVTRGDDEDNERFYYESDPEGNTEDYQALASCKKLEFYRAYGLKFDLPFLRALDAGGVHLKKLHLGIYFTLRFFELLIKSNQINTIESLTLSGYCFADMTEYKVPSIKFIEKLAKFPKLKHLRINESRDEVAGHDYNRVPLDLLLEYLKCIESIHMDFATFEISDETDTPFKTTLKTLILEESYVEAALYKKQASKGLHSLSEEFLAKKLPNTNIIHSSMDDACEEDDYAHLYSYDSQYSF